MSEEEKIPDIVIGRLPIYLRALTYMAREGLITTSSNELSRRIDIGSAQIRRDIAQIAKVHNNGGFGKQGTGYHIKYLIDQLRKILKLDHLWPVAVIGAGFLGHAVANYTGFIHRGFDIGWIFDDDPSKIGNVINDLDVQPISELEETIQQEGIQIALLAVPAAEAQAVADKLVAAGIKAILNYAPINLHVPEGVLVSYSDPVVQLQHMTYYLDPFSSVLSRSVDQ